MTKKKNIDQKHEAARRNAWSAGVPLVPDLVLERESAFRKRMRALKKPGSIRICNSSMPRDDHYRTGSGEVVQPVRPGADDHMAHPSLYVGVRIWRSGRVVTL